ncbi:LLM class flavin-dependent oxidoreductase [Cellulomonas sp. JH27-2]|uniref:LLM class flavin-dependent oxidoreductase n=1 Tax=Cellulomonas sp. JH27-2 TaxID=2774139 RepID=UPI00178255C2|nr:LLM class flavin-dependent oxidoreductase [Cellulomonas sp. JH27-2]MBD8058378.1 LLM class flavin-dependent oxidoreductase [Cellulomonas sp. JH27-2]
MTSVLHIALEVDGAGQHPAAHLVEPHTTFATPAARPGVTPDAHRLRTVVAAAENAGVTFVTFDDSLVPVAGRDPHRVDAVTRAAFAAPLTSRIGLVPLVHPAVTEPFHLASQLAALDHASTGRSGWLVGAGAVPGARAALDRPVADGQDLADETADVVTVVRDLWDSWDDDAVIRDTATGRYIDRDRLHYVDFASGGDGPAASPALRSAPDGRRAPFTVKGPLIVPRGPQGQSVVVGRAGAVPGELLDIALVSSLGQAQGTGAPLVLVDVAVTLDTDTATGAQRLEALDRSAAHTPDAVVFTGSAAGLVALLTSLRGVVDGVRILPSVIDDDVPVLVRDVLPALRVARALPTPRPGATLRDTLGLPRPTSRFAATA